MFKFWKRRHAVRMIPEALQADLSSSRRPDMDRREAFAVLRGKPFSDSFRQGLSIDPERALPEEAPPVSPPPPQAAAPDSGAAATELVASASSDVEVMAKPPAAAELERPATPEADALPESPIPAPMELGGPPLTREEFDEAAYLAANQDIANAVAAGITSAYDHYVRHGRRERRRLRPGQPPAEMARQHLAEMARKHNGAYFLNPADLGVSQTPLRRVLLIGSCLLQSWHFHTWNASGCPADMVVVNNASDFPSEIDADQYDLQVVQIPLRYLFPDSILWHIPHDAVDEHQRAFEDVCDRLAFHLKCRMSLNESHGLLTFVTNFFVPQRNPLGSLFPRHDIRNPEYFIAKLNERLEAMVRGYKNAFVLDVDRISASLGRRHVQDDSVLVLSHGSLLPIVGPIADRIEPMAAITDHYELINNGHALFQEATWAELISMYRTVRQADSVKMVVVDLDDTLWTGVSGDVEEIDQIGTEGWPLGLAEALIYLKKRGVLLGIISRNEEVRIREIWPRIYTGRLRMEDFAAVSINWGSKVESMQRLLEQVNLLPRNVVFIDDNPVERAAMQTRYPRMRVLGRFPYYLRRILLWSSEAQVVSITEESARRTEMVQVQAQRDTERKVMSRQEFLESARVSVRLFMIDSLDSPKFARVMELVNKTNQFNTTGERWQREQFADMLRIGCTLHAFEVSDRYIDYGLVGVVIISHDGTIQQWVMSCRVLGYQIEEAVAASIIGAIRSAGRREVVGILRKTEVNFPCRDLFAKCGFVEDPDGRWVLAGDVVPAAPSHIALSQVA